MKKTPDNWEEWEYLTNPPKEEKDHPPLQVGDVVVLRGGLHIFLTYLGMAEDDDNSGVFAYENTDGVTTLRLPYAAVTI